MLWQWPQGLQLSEWREGLRTPAILWQWRFKLQGEFVSFRVTKPLQDRSQSSTSEQMSHSHADLCVLWQLPLPLCNCSSEVVVFISSSQCLFFPQRVQSFKCLLCDPLSYLTRVSVQKSLNEWGFSDTACDSCCENVLLVQINQNLGSSVRTSRPYFLQSQALSSSLDIQTNSLLQKIQSGFRIIFSKAVQEHQTVLDCCIVSESSLEDFRQSIFLVKRR